MNIPLRRFPCLSRKLKHLVRARTARYTDGLGMLVHQAAAQLVLWTGMEPPLEAMWRAVSELVTYGAFKTLDLGRFSYGRIVKNAPLKELNVV